MVDLEDLRQILFKIDFHYTRKVLKIENQDLDLLLI